jgi:exodeoxyribonuclease III
MVTTLGGVTLPTRARNIGWRIDYVLVSSQLRAAVQAAEIHPQVMGSDHCPVSITLAKVI